MPPSSHSLFKQQRRQKLRLILVLFLSIPLIVEIKSHYYSAVDDDVYVENSAARPFVPRRGNEMEQHLQQLGQRVIIDGNDKDVARMEAMRYVISQMEYEKKGTAASRLEPNPEIVEVIHNAEEADAYLSSHAGY